jgi:hypothetical protein
MAIVMGLDQHRAQITADWIDTDTGEVSRARVSPALRGDVRRFLRRFAGRQLEVALGGRRRGGGRSRGRWPGRAGRVGPARGRGVEALEDALELVRGDAGPRSLTVTVAVWPLAASSTLTSAVVGLTRSALASRLTSSWRSASSSPASRASSRRMIRIGTAGRRGWASRTAFTTA